MATLAFAAVVPDSGGCHKTHCVVEGHQIYKLSLLLVRPCQNAGIKATLDLDSFLPVVSGGAANHHVTMSVFKVPVERDASFGSATGRLAVAKLFEPGSQIFRLQVRQLRLHAVLALPHLA